IKGDNTVYARKVIFCTGFEATRMLKERTAKLFYTWACVSEEHIPVKEKLHNTLVWNTANPYFYMRTVDTRLLLGGEDSPYKNLQSLQRLREKKAIALIKK